MESIIKQVYWALGDYSIPKEYIGNKRLTYIFDPQKGHQIVDTNYKIEEIEIILLKYLIHQEMFENRCRYPDDDVEEAVFGKDWIMIYDAYVKETEEEERYPVRIENAWMVYVKGREAWVYGLLKDENEKVKKYLEREYKIEKINGMSIKYEEMMRILEGIKL